MNRQTQNGGDNKSVVPFDKSKVTPSEAQDMLNQALIGNEVPLTRAEIFEILGKVSDNDLEVINKEYFKFELGETYNLIVTGYCETTISNKKQRVVELEDMEGKKYINGSAVLVNNTYNKIEQLPCFIRVKVGKHKIKAKEGDYFDLEVLTFPGASANGK